MIVSVSRRTDIPAFFADWFYSRLKAGYVYAQNPFNPKMLRRVSLRKEYVTCFVFWTKNPENFLARIDELEGYNYYFQFTLTSYQNDIETNLPKKSQLIETFINLSKKIGKEKLIWRYDPILINDKYTKEYHFKWFEVLCSKLQQYTDKCIISFVDIYANTKRNAKVLNLKKITPSEAEDLASGLNKIAQKYRLKLEACSENIDFSKYRIPKARCIDGELIERIGGKKIDIPKDPYQRKDCCCLKSVDIGIYNTCMHECLYCYANYNKNAISNNLKRHEINSPLLIGNINDN